MALGHAPFGVWYVSLAACAVLIARAPSTTLSAFTNGWLAGLGYFAVALHWIVEPFLVDIARHGWMAPFALIFLSGGLALFWGSAFWVANRLAPRAVVLALPATWILAELARSLVLTGFPWALPGYIWIDTPIAQAAAFIGPHGLGFVTMLLASFFAFAWLKHRVLLVVPLATLALLWVGLAQRIPTTTVQTDSIIRLIQPNAAQHLKWQPDMVQTFFDRQLDYTSKTGAPDLVVWPEAAVPYFLGDRPDLDALIATSAPNNAHLLVGIRKVIETVDRVEFRNSAMVLNPDGTAQTSYDKHHLVPFGEFLPFPSVFETLGLSALAANAGRYSRGDGPVTINIDGLPSFQPLICYEAIFPHEILTGDARPDWLLHVTNDAWFGTFSGPYQHLDQARMRAIENGLPVARAANTGISTMIDPYGRMDARLALNSEGYLDSVLPQALPPTLFSRTGTLPGLLVMVLFLIGIVAFSRRAPRAEPLGIL